jgi:transcriptional regulator with XRE-family HTH domain
MSNQFGDNLKKIRTDKNMTQADLGKLIFLSAQAISKWEKGESSPDVDMIVQLAKVLQVDANTLFGTNINSQESLIQENPKMVSKEDSSIIRNVKIWILVSALLSIFVSIVGLALYAAFYRKWIVWISCPLSTFLLIAVMIIKFSLLSKITSENGLLSKKKMITSLYLYIFTSFWLSTGILPIRLINASSSYLYSWFGSKENTFIFVISLTIIIYFLISLFLRKLKVFMPYMGLKKINRIFLIILALFTLMILIGLSINFIYQKSDHTYQYDLDEFEVIQSGYLLYNSLLDEHQITLNENGFPHYTTEAYNLLYPNLEEDQYRYEDIVNLNPDTLEVTLNSWHNGFYIYSDIEMDVLMFTFYLSIYATAYMITAKITSKSINNKEFIEI